MITTNLSRAFFILMCCYALFSIFFSGKFSGRLHWAVQLLIGNLSDASFSGFVTSPANSYREDLGNGAHSFRSISVTRISKHLQMSQLRWQHIALRYFKTQAWTLDLRRSTTWTNQAAVFESLLTFSYALYPQNRHWHTRYNWHLECSYLPQTTQSSFDEIRE